MRLLIFAASLRTGSLNRQLAEYVARLAARVDHVEVDLLDFRDVRMPVYDGDLEASDGMPEGAAELVARVREADALVIVTPEYNGSIPGPLKNAIDWVSRSRPMPWRGKSVLLMAASPGALGGMRALAHTRVPLDACGSLVFPDIVALGRATSAFNEEGDLVDAAADARLRTTLGGFLALARTLSPVCGRGDAISAEIVQALEHQSTEVQPASAV